MPSRFPPSRCTVAFQRLRFYDVGCGVCGMLGNSDLEVRGFMGHELWEQPTHGQGARDDLQGGKDGNV